MKTVQYVLLDPSGNRTALVTEWGGPEEEKEIIRRLLLESEQAAFLEAARIPGAAARLRLMGGEFCGNAAMAAAGWLVRGRLQPGCEITVPLEVSGAEGIVSCRVRGLEDGSFEGTAEMPRVLEIREETRFGERWTAVRTEGILHRIREGAVPLQKEKAEEMLAVFSAEAPDPAVGLLDRNPETGFMRPLVYVRGSGSMVWETACGSGSAAVAAAQARRAGTGRVRIAVKQPGGVIRAEAAAEAGTVTEVSITGIVRIVGERRISPEPEG